MNTEYNEGLAEDLAIAAAFDEFTNYEQERGKPIPSKNLSRIQAALSALFYIHYRKSFTIYSELSLDLVGDKLTPDICLYPYTPSNWLYDQNPTLSVAYSHFGLSNLLCRPFLFSRPMIRYKSLLPVW